jgi:hypothetical protein
MDSRVHLHVYSMIVPSLRRDLNVDAGASVSDMLRHVGIPESAHRYLSIAFEGFHLPQDQWSRLRPKGGTHLQVGVFPAGDGQQLGKDQLRQAAYLATIVGGYLVPGAFGLSGIAAGVLQMGLTAAGAWAINTFIPYQRQGQATDRTLTSVRNQARQYGVIPTVHGRMRIVAPLAAAPQTQIRGDSHYIRLLLCLGYKPLHVDPSTLKIGETSVREFDGIEYEINDGWQHSDEITLFSADIDETPMDQRVGYAETWRVDESGAPIPDRSNTPGKTSPGVVSLTTPTGTARVDIDLTFPDGLGRRNGQSVDHFTVSLQLQVRPAGSRDELGWRSIVPQGERDQVARIFYREVDRITRSQCVSWMRDLSAVVGDLVDAAEVFPAEERNVPQDIYELVYSVAFSLQSNVNSPASGLEYIGGERPAWDSLKFQVRRVLSLCATVLKVLEPEDTDYNTDFQSAFEKLVVPVEASKRVVAVRNKLGNSDTIQLDETNVARLITYSVNLPQIFETHPTDYFEISPQEAKGGLFRRNIWTRLEPAKWEIRLRKTTPDHENDANYLDEVRVTAFRCHRVAPAVSDTMRGKLALMAIEVLATDQLTGSLDQVNVEVERPVYYSPDGVEWTGPALVDGDGNRLSRNPAWVLTDILTQPPAQRPIPVERIDLPTLKEFADFCESKAFHYCRFQDSRGTVHRALQEACAVARATPTIRDGRYSVIWDRPQATPRAVISLSNATDFESGKTFQKRPQALRMRFKNPSKDWSDDELHVYDDGFGPENRLEYRNEVIRATATTGLSMVSKFQDVNAIYDVGNAAYLNIDNYNIGLNTAGTRTVITPRSSTYNFRQDGHYSVIGHVVARTPDRVEEINIPGLVDVPGDATHPMYSGQVYKLGRYLLAVAKLRPEIMQARLDYENFVFERGDRVEVQMDTVLWGLGSSRIRSIGRVSSGPNAGKIESVTVEQDLALLDGTKYAVRFRSARNQITGESTFIFDDSEPDTITLEVPMNDASNPMAPGDLVAWGEPSKTTTSCIVQEIRPQRDMAAEVTLIQYSPGVFEAETGPIPEFDPRITIPPNPEPHRPPAPVILKVTTDESVLERDTDGSLAARIVIDLRLPSGDTRAERNAASRVDAIHVQFRRSLPAPSNFQPDWIRSGIYARDATRVSIRDVEDGQTYDIRIRAVTKEGVPSKWTELPSVFVEGKLTPPPDVENLRWLNDKLVWDYPNPPFDHAGFLIRYIHGRGGNWYDAVPAHPGRLLVSEFATEFNYEGDRSYLVKAVDTSGIESRNAKIVTRSAATVPGVFEVRRVNGTLSGDAFTLVGDTYELNPDAGDQWLDPFYKGRKTDPFYAEPEEAFYHRTYRFGNIFIGAGSWVSGTPAGPTARWIPVTQIVQAPPYAVRGFANGIPLWPESMLEALWPTSMSENYWPDYFGYQDLKPDGVPHLADIEAPEGITASFIAAVPSSNIQTKIKGIGAALVVPLRVERVHDFEVTSTTPGTGDEVPLLGEFVNIVSAQATLRDDAAGGSVRIVKGATTVEVFIYDANGDRTTGFVDIVVEGY